MNICFYAYLNPILPLVQISLFSFHFRYFLLRLYSGHRELRVLKTGYLNTLPVILGQSCPLSAGLYGVFGHKIRFLFPFLLGDILVMGKR